GWFFEATEKVYLAEMLTTRQSENRIQPRPQYVWDRAWVLVLVLTWAGVEWIARRTIGWL
ncbi:MAG: hypothetical protein R3236_05860, partial [Phycisphaeraceae bacterium]|nr:hypothetical protein [Phycisphaeraceae bacterium]